MRKLVGVLLLSLVANFSHAQQSDQDKPGTLSCTSNAGNGTVLPENTFRLASISDVEAGDAISGVKPIRFTGFARKYGVSEIKIAFKEVVTERSQWPNRNAELRLYVSDSRNWYRLESVTADDDDKLWVEQSGDSDANDGDPGTPEHVRVSLGTPNATLPIIRIEFTANLNGASTVTEAGRIILLDFLDKSPRVFFALECIELEGGGACNAPRNAMAGSETLTCDWNDKAQKFWCLKSEESGYRRRGQSQRLALPGNTPLPYDVQPGQPTSLIEFAGLLQRDPGKASKKAQIPGLGEVSLLFRTDSENRQAFVFGMQDDADSYNGRFAGVVLGGDQPVVQRIVPKLLLKETTEKSAQTESAQEETTLSPPPWSTMPHTHVQFRVSEMKIAKPAVVYQVTATESDVHAVNWIVAWPTQNGFRFDAVKIASDYNEPNACGPTVHEQTALSVRKTLGALSADIVAQSAFEEYNDFPAGLENMDEEQYAAFEKKGCPVNVHLSWNSDRGLVVRHSAMECTDKVRGRFVEISPEGRITVVADYRNK